MAEARQQLTIFHLLLIEEVYQILQLFTIHMETQYKQLGFKLEIHRDHIQTIQFQQEESGRARHKRQ